MCIDIVVVGDDDEVDIAHLDQATVHGPPARLLAGRRGRQARQHGRGPMAPATPDLGCELMRSCHHLGGRADVPDKQRCQLISRDARRSHPGSSCSPRRSAKDRGDHGPYEQLVEEVLGSAVSARPRIGLRRSLSGSATTTIGESKRMGPRTRSPPATRSRRTVAASFAASVHRTTCPDDCARHRQRCFDCLVHRPISTGGADASTVHPPGGARCQIAQYVWKRQPAQPAGPDRVVR